MARVMNYIVTFEIGYCIGNCAMATHDWNFSLAKFENAFLPLHPSLCTISNFSHSAAPNSYGNRAHIISAQDRKSMTAGIYKIIAQYFYTTKTASKKIPIAISKIHPKKLILKYNILYMNLLIIYVFLSCVMYRI